MIRAFQWDLARQVERLDWLVAQLPRYADWGYEELYLHLEDAVEYPSLPGVARSDAYSYSEFTELVESATRVGIKVVPIVNLLGHTQYLIKVPELRDLNELRAADGSPLESGQICPLHPRAVEIAEKLLRDMAPFCTAGKVHVGLDESFHLGKHPLSRAEVDERGLAWHFAAYVRRLHGLTSALGLRLGMWADMLYFIPDAIAQLPPDIIAYDWYYYSFRKLPRVELFNFAERDLAGPLRARGIEYWGCPMNGAFRYEPMPIFGERLANIRSWWQRCQQVDAGGMLITSWEPNRLAMETTTVADATAASLWLDPQLRSNVDLLARGFERVFGKKYHGKTAARVALACDSRAFAGYARWEINDRWDVAGTGDDIRTYAAELRFFERLVRQQASSGVSRRLPPPIAATIGFRRYLAVRDVFVRNATRGVLRSRRILRNDTPPDAGRQHRVRSIVRTLGREAADFAKLLRAGRRAARAMWQRTRDPAVRGPNEHILDLDEQRLKTWRAWLRAATRQPTQAWQASPVCGAWQLEFIVHNLAPAVQKVVVQECDPTGRWVDLHGRFTIEFRAAAARPRSTVRRRFSVPVRSRDTQLRIGVRGIGQVGISRIVLTNGVVDLQPDAPRRSRIQKIGEPAPSAGLPEIDWSTDRGTISLRFG